MDARLTRLARTAGSTLCSLAALAIGAAPATATTVWAVGDGANSSSNDDAVAAMIAGQNPDAFIYLGDVYGSGTAAQYNDYYAPGYGLMKSITLPTPGNHEWGNRATGYDAYWGSAFTTPHYFSRDIGDWHLISLNSEENTDYGSPQLDWLNSDLAGHAGACTLAFAHKPRYSTGGHGDDDGMDPIWQSLASRTAITLFGHNHFYERLKPIDRITSFVVGTGGAGQYAVNPSDPRLAAYNDTSFGALRLTLHADRADFTMFAVSGAVLDSGSVPCEGTDGGGSTGGSSPGVGSSPMPIGGPGGPDEARDTTAPTLSLAGASHVVKVKRGKRARLRFRLSEPSKVTLTLSRKSGHRFVKIRQSTTAGATGKNLATVPSRTSGKRLRGGLYRIHLVATDASGNASSGQTVLLRVAG